MLRYEFAWNRLMIKNKNELEKRNQERLKSGRGRSSYYLPPSAGWIQSDDHGHQDDDHDHEQDVRAELNDVDESTGFVATDERSAAIVQRGDQVASRGVLAVLRNEPKDVSRAAQASLDVVEDASRNEASSALEGESAGETGEPAPLVLRNEPKDISGVLQRATGDAGGSLRNEPKVISEVVAVARANGDVEEEERAKRDAVRPDWFDKAISGVMGGGEGEPRPGIRLRDAIRTGNRDGRGGGGSRRQRRRRNKEAARAKAG